MSVQVYLPATIRFGIHHSFGGRDMEPRNMDDRSGPGYGSDFTFDHMVEHTALDLRLKVQMRPDFGAFMLWYPARYHSTALTLMLV
jgi:hypothetical protein